MDILDQFFQKEIEGILNTLTNPPLIVIGSLILILYLEFIKEN